MLSYALNKGDINGFKYFVSGSRDITRFSAQTVNYLESHDDKCLFDRITTLCEHPSLDDLRRYKLAYSLVFLSIGIPMAEEGFDLVRTKQGKNNTYKDGKANELDYARATRFTGVCQWLRSLAKFRQSQLGKALRIDGELPNGWIKFFEIENSSAIGVMFNAIKDKNCKQIFATFNPTDSEVELPIDDNFNFKQIADIDRFDERGLDNPISLINNGKLRLARVSMSLWIEQ
jgi:pullulanase/glycogen debranching enzyme